MENLIFHDFVPHNEVIEYIYALDASIVRLKRHPLFKTVIPSKIFEHMALGVPIIMAVVGESADIIERAGCGVLVSPGDTVALADAVQMLASNPERLAELGEAAGRTAREKFDRKMLIQAALVCLEQVVSKGLWM